MKKIGMILLIVTIVLFNVIIGANEKGLRELPISILLTMIIIYLIIKKIRNRKENIVLKSKIDYFVLFFMLITTFPLIFKTYASYSDTMEWMMKYFFIYSVYLLARNVIIEKKQIGYLIVTTLVSSIISVLMGFLDIHFNFMEGFIKWLNVFYQRIREFDATFGYANTLAIYMSFCIYLAIYRFKENKNKVLKVLDILYIIFAIIVLAFTEAKAVYALLLLSLFVLFVIKSRKQIVKHKIKILIIVGALIIVFASFLAVALKISAPVVSNDKTIEKTIKQDFSKDVTYNLELELNVDFPENVTDEIKSNTKLKVMEVGPYFKDKAIAIGNLKDIEGKIEVKFKPTQDIKYIKIVVQNPSESKVELIKCYIDGKEHILKYKFIPQQLRNMFKEISFDANSIKQRLYMYGDSLKIAKENPILGNGGDAWKNLHTAVQDYKYGAKETHSYSLELLINYGIVGLISFLLIVIVLFKKIFKQCVKDENKRKEKLLIAMGLFILLLHSITIDFNMSFMLIQILVYIYIAVLLYDEQKGENKLRYNDVVVLVFLVFVLNLYIRADISKYLVQDPIGKYNITQYNKVYYNNSIFEDIKNQEDIIKLLDEAKDLINKEPYYNQTLNYEMYFRLICQNTDAIPKDMLQDYMDFIVNKIKTIKFKNPMDAKEVLNRADMLVSAIKNLEKYQTNKNKVEILNKSIAELKDIVNKEYDANIKNITDFNRVELNEIEIYMMQNQYQKIVDSIK